MDTVRIREAGLIGRLFREAVGPSKMDEFRAKGTNLCAVVGNIFVLVVFVSVLCSILVGVMTFTVLGLYAFIRQIIVPVERPGTEALVGFLVVGFAVFVSVIALIVWGVRKLLRTEAGRIFRAWCAAKKAKVCPRVEFW